MTEQKPLKDEVSDALLKSALLASANPFALQNAIHSMLGVSIPVKELQQINSYFQLVETIKREQNNIKTL